MPSPQGKYPKIFIPGGMVGPDESGATTNNSYDYRGRPYSFANGYDQAAFDFTREHAKVSWQQGLKVVALYCTTSQNFIQETE